MSSPNHANYDSSLRALVPVIGKFLYLAFYMGVFLGTGLGTGIGYGLLTVPELLDSKLSSPPLLFSFVEYERIKMDMTVTEVQAILGRGTEIRRSNSTAVFVWNNPSSDSPFIKVKFERGKLTEKEYLGL